MSPDERCVQRDHVHEHTESELLLQQPVGNAELHEAQLGVEKQLDRVVARLSVDVDASGEIGSP